METFLEKGWWQYGEEQTLIQQNINVKSFFLELLTQETPELIIEIGTSFGGLTVLLSDCIKELGLNTKLISYDNAIREYIPTLAEKFNFTLINKSIGHFDTDLELQNLIKNTPGKVVLLCDGGGKSYEFNTFSSSLKTGDIISAHDYADNIEDFETRVKGKIWNWMEIEYAHIRNSVEDNNLVDLDNDLTAKGKDVAWIFKIKK